MLSRSVFLKQYWTEDVATVCYTENRSTIMKRHIKTPYVIFHKIIPNINFLHVFGCPVYIRNHKDHLGKFDEKADDGYLLGYLLVSIAFRVFNTKRQQTEETYHITFYESPDAIKFSKPTVDNINFTKNERYPPDEYLLPYEPYQSTKLCKLFAKLMTQRYEISMMGVLTYFIRFQNKQSERVKTPMVPPNKLGPDLNDKAVNKTQYRGMIGSIMYLTASRLDIQFLTCLCARYQANPKESHLIAVKRIFRYLKGKAPQVPIFSDNTSAIAISNNPVLHSRTKHINIRYHYIRDHVLKGDTELHFVPTQYQLDDIFTKPLDEPTFKRLIVKLVVGEMYKEAQQAVDGPTSLGATGEEGAHLQLSSGHDALADFTAEAELGNSSPNDSIHAQQDQTKSARDGLKTAHTNSGTNKEPRADEISKKIKLEDLSDLLKNTRSVFFTLDSPQDEPIIISDESKEEEVEKKMTLMLLLMMDLKTLQSYIFHELPAEFQALPSQESLVLELKTLDSLPILLNKVTDTLNGFSTMVKNASGVARNIVPSAGQASSSPAERERNTTKDAKTNLQNELVDLLGIDMMEQYHKKDELEQQKEKAKAEVALLKARPSYPDTNQLTDLLVTSLKPEFSKLLASHDVASCLPNALKELPSKFTKLSSDIKELKKHVQDMKIELSGDLK
nr:retrotransposon protein, putative, unclassified [Tanacetum cinerariifolium]